MLTGDWEYKPVLPQCIQLWDDPPPQVPFNNSVNPKACHSGQTANELSV